MTRINKKELNSSIDIGNAICNKICNDIRELSKVRGDIKELGKARVAIAGLSEEITAGAEESEALETAARAGTDVIEAHAGELEAPIAVSPGMQHFDAARCQQGSNEDEAFMSSWRQ